MSDCMCLDCKKDSKLLSYSVKSRAKNRRTELTKMIEKNSGIQFGDLMRLTNLKNGVLNHHLRRFEKTGSVKVEMSSQQTRFYPVGFSDEESMVAKALRRKTPRDIMHTLMLNGEDDEKGLDFNHIVSDVSKSPSTISPCLSQLIKDSIVTVTRDFGRKKKHHLYNRIPQQN